MNKDFASLIKFLRVKDSIPQELLAKKINLSKSHLSMIERSIRPLRVDDFENALNYLGAEIIITKDGEDCMEQMRKEGFGLTDVGYCKEYRDIKGNPVRVELCTLTNLNAVVAKDFKNLNEYLSKQKYDEYEEIYSNEQGYGEFYEEYIEGDRYWEVILKCGYKEDVVINENAYKIFDENIINEIKNDLLALIE